MHVVHLYDIENKLFSPTFSLKSRAHTSNKQINKQTNTTTTTKQKTKQRIRYVFEIQFSDAIENTNNEIKFNKTNKQNNKGIHPNFVSMSSVSLE